MPIREFKRMFWTSYVSLFLIWKSYQARAFVQGPAHAMPSPHEEACTRGSSDQCCEAIFASHFLSRPNPMNMELPIQSDFGLRDENDIRRATFACIDTSPVVSIHESIVRGRYSLLCAIDEFAHVYPSVVDGVRREKVMCQSLPMQHRQPVPIKPGLTDCMDIATAPSDWLTLDSRTWVTQPGTNSRSSGQNGHERSSHRSNVVSAAKFSWYTFGGSTTRSTKFAFNTQWANFKLTRGQDHYRVCASNAPGNRPIELHWALSPRN